jgi:hypothetical protein
MACHGVNNGMSIKTGLQSWRENGDPVSRYADLTQDLIQISANPKRAIEVLDQYHGLPSGVFSADELYAGNMSRYQI